MGPIEAQGAAVIWDVKFEVRSGKVGLQHLKIGNFLHTFSKVKNVKLGKNFSLSLKKI